MEQIQQKGSRDGNAIFAQMAGPASPGQAGRRLLRSLAKRARGPQQRRGAPSRRTPLDPRQDFAKECAGAASLEKDLM